MSPRPGDITAVSRRRGFTLVELLTASLITAMVAAASTTLIFAIGDASKYTKDLRETKTAGHYALARIGNSIRCARAIGNVTPTCITFWEGDANGDDLVQVKELGSISYDGSNKRISYTTMSNSTDTSTVVAAAFVNQNSVKTLLTAAGSQTVIWAEGVESLTFLGYPNDKDTRIVDATFTIGTGVEASAFQVSASPRACGDYLYSPTANGTPLTGSTRIRRVKITPFNGLSAAAMPLP